MSLPNVNLTVQDGGLGAVQAQESNTVVVIGNSSSGTANVVNGAYTRKSTLIADYGYGRGIEAAAFYLAAGIPVIFVKTANTTAGSCGSVTKVGSGATVMSVTAQVPRDDAEVVIKATSSGTVGTDTIKLQFSLDGGITFSADQSMPATTFAIPNFNVTCTFTAATIVSGDTFSFTATGNIWTAGDITSAMAALQAQTQLSWRMIHIAGPASAAVAGTVDTAAQAMRTAFRYVGNRVILDSVGFSSTDSAWVTALLADFASFSSAGGLVGVGAGPVRIASAVSNYGFRVKRSVAWLAVRKAMLGTIHTDISELTPIPGITDLTGFTIVYHDETTGAQGLDAAGFITMRTITGRTGYFITNPNMMAPSGSDFNLLQYGLVADVACATYRQYFLTALNKPVRVDNNGHILEKDAQTLESGANAAVRDALVSPGHVSPSTMTQKFVGSIPGPTSVARDDNILSTKTLTVNGFVIPLGYTKFINLTFGFRNPATQIAA